MRFFFVNPTFALKKRGTWVPSPYPLMHPLARPPVREVRLKRQAGTRAFTLIELLTVIAIIAILVGITFGVIKGVNERAAIGQAKAELAVLAQALEAYKKQYGDYPQTVERAVFLQSLIGKKGPKGDPISGKAFIETSRFTFNSSTANPFSDAAVYLVDPWGRQYCYYYKASNKWVAPSYVLLSAGPDGYTHASTPASGAYTALLNENGTLKDTAATNSGSVDNIYANN